MTQPVGQALVGPMVPRPFVVRAARRETYDTYTVELIPAEGDPRFHFAPGQFNMLYLFGRGEVPISISGDPAQPQSVIHTTRRVGNVTEAICQLKAGAGIGLRGPFGSAWPVEEALGKDVVIVAGGIGLAPLRPALHALCARRERYGRISVLYGARTPRDILFRSQLRSWSSRLDIDVMATVDRGTVDWRGNVGVVTNLVRRAGFDPLHTLAMVCGPEVMMRFSVEQLRERGVADEQIWVSMERNMKCGIGLCGHCQFGTEFVCKDGPVFRYDRIAASLDVREL